MAKYVDIEKVEYPYMSISMYGIDRHTCRTYNEGVKATEDMLQALPTANVVEITVEQAESMVDFLEAEFIHGIGSDPDLVDSEYVQNIREVYDKLKEVCKNEGSFTF